MYTTAVPIYSTYYIGVTVVVCTPNIIYYNSCYSYKRIAIFRDRLLSPPPPTLEAVPQYNSIILLSACRVNHIL